MYHNGALACIRELRFRYFFDSKILRETRDGATKLENSSLKAGMLANLLMYFLSICARRDWLDVEMDSQRSRDPPHYDLNFDRSLGG